MKHYHSLTQVITGTATAAILIAQSPVSAAPATQVKSVKINPSNNGINLILETDNGARPQIFIVNRGNDFVADIINTQLRSDGGNFRQNNPAPGISSVVVSQLDANSIRVIVSGTNRPPTGQISDRTGPGISFNITSAPGAVAQAPPTTTPPTTPRANQTTTAQTPQTPAPQTPAPQTPVIRSPSGDVLVPNPEITIQGQPAPSTGPNQPISPVPPFLPRAVPPPLGDIAVSGIDVSSSNIDLGTAERVPRLVLRDAPVRDVLALLARAANINLAFTTGPQSGATGQAAQAATSAVDGPKISLDIENEPVQDVFNYVLRVSGLEANRVGRTIFVGTKLPDSARNVASRTLRLNQVGVLDAVRFLIAQGAERNELRLTTQVSTIGDGPNAPRVTNTQTQVELLAADKEGSPYKGAAALPLKGLLITPDERTNAVTLLGDPRKIEIAIAMLSQIDLRRRQVAVNVKIIDVNLLNTEDRNASFSFGVGKAFIVSDGGSLAVNYGGYNPPTSGQVAGSIISPTVISNPLQGSVFLNPNSTLTIPNAGTGNTIIQDGFIRTQTSADVNFLNPIAPFGRNGDPTQPGITGFTPGTNNTTTITTNVDGTRTSTFAAGQQATATFGLPTLFQFPTRFLSLLQAQVVSGNAKILTDPTLVVQEGQQAKINLTQQVFGGFEVRTESTSPTGGGIATTTQARKPILNQAGLILNIAVDRIDDNGFISLSVNPEVSAPANSVSTPDGPITLISQRQLQSGLIRLRDGQTLILAGIIQDSDRVAVTKLPILGDLPIIGALFRKTNRNNQRNEVIVVMTPQIIDDSEKATWGYGYTPGRDAREMLQRQQNNFSPGTR